MFLNIQYLFLLPNQHLFSLKGKAVFTKFPIKKCRPAATLLREFVSQILLSFSLRTSTFLFNKKELFSVLKSLHCKLDSSTPVGAFSYKGRKFLYVIIIPYFPMENKALSLAKISFTSLMWFSFFVNSLPNGA